MTSYEPIVEGQHGPKSGTFFRIAHAHCLFRHFRFSSGISDAGLGTLSVLKSRRSVPVFLCPREFYPSAEPFRSLESMFFYYTYILLTKREGRTGRISARGLDSTDRAPIFSQYGPEQVWLIRDLLHD